MQEHLIKVHPSSAQLSREDQFAWKLAEFATSKPPISDDVAEIISCRIVDNASVALVSLNRTPVINALRMALAHPRAGGATLSALDPIQLYTLNGRLGPMVQPCTNSISMTRTWQRITPIRVTVSRRLLLWPNSTGVQGPPWCAPLRLLTRSMFGWLSGFVCMNIRRIIRRT